MNILPANPVLQALSGAQETGTQRQQASVSAAGQAVTARAVSALEKTEHSKPSQLKTRREPEDQDKDGGKGSAVRGQPSVIRGQHVDILI